MKCGHDSHWSQHIHNVALWHSFDVANLYVHVGHSTFSKAMMPGPYVKHNFECILVCNEQFFYIKCGHDSHCSHSHVLLLSTYTQCCTFAFF